MMRWLGCLIGCTLLVLAAGARAAAPDAPRPKRAIIYIPDGMRWDAPERIELPVWQALAKEGTRFEKVYHVTPHHQHLGSWEAIHSTSIPNVLLVTGSLFVRAGQPQVQDMFHPARQTAHVTNSNAYASIDRSMDHSVLDPQLDPMQVAEQALALFRDHNIAYMRIHQQTPGNGGGRSLYGRDAGPARYNVYGEGSQYVRELQAVDAALGRLVEGLKEQGKWEETLLIVTGDHGQSMVGWHPMTDPAAWVVPALIVGPGVKQGAVFPQAEHIDLVPTLCDLMGVEPPNPGAGCGVVLEEVRTGAPERATRQDSPTLELNRQMLEGMRLDATARLLALEDPVYWPIAARIESRFLGIDEILQWPEKESFEKLMEDNAAVLAQAREQLRAAAEARGINWPTEQDVMNTFATE